MAGQDDQNNSKLPVDDMDFKSIIESMMQTEDQLEDQTDDEQTDDEDIDDQDTEEQDDEDEEEEEETVEEEPKKQTQTPEERKANAAARRQKEFEDRVQAEMQKRMNDLPEVQVARQMAQMYNTTPEQVLQVLRQAELDRQARLIAQRDGVSEEVAKRQLSTEQELSNVKFEMWRMQTEAQRPALLSQFPMLSDDDVNAAIYYQTEVLKQPNMPLEQSVWALHGRKIMEGQQKNARQENLAEKSGRKKSPLPMQGGGKSSKSATLSPDEQYIARKFGMTDEEYLKYKTD